MRDDALSRADLPGANRELDPGAHSASRVLVVDTDPALFGLIAEWLGAEGYSVMPPCGGAMPGPIDLVIVDVPFPRQGGLDRLKHLAAEYPDTPILALSSTFFAGIESNGAVAHALGAAGVLAKPLTRSTLIAAARSLPRRSCQAGTP